MVSVESVALTFAGVSALWLARQIVLTREIVIRVQTAVFGVDGQGGVVNAMHALEQRLNECQLHHASPERGEGEV